MDGKTIKTLLEMRNFLSEHFNYLANRKSRFLAYEERLKPGTLEELGSQAGQICQVYVSVITALENVPESQRHLLRELDV